MGIRTEIDLEGVQELAGVLEGLENVKSFREPLKKTKKYILGRINSQFDKEGAEFGKRQKWEKLSPDYKRQKQKTHPGKPILQRTGKMKNSFRSSISKNTLVIRNNRKYFKYHQSNASRSKLPRRPVFEIDQPARNEISRFVTKFLSDKFRNIIRRKSH